MGTHDAPACSSQLLQSSWQCLRAKVGWEVVAQCRAPVGAARTYEWSQCAAAGSNVSDVFSLSPLVCSVLLFVLILLLYFKQSLLKQQL